MACREDCLSNMVAPTFRRTTITDTGTSVSYGGNDQKYLCDVLDGTHPTDRIQAENIEGIENAFDIIVYPQGGNIYARHKDGILLTSGTFNTSDRTVINAALAYANTISPRPLTVLLKPAIYSLNDTLTFYPDTTLVGYGATLKWTAGTIAANPRNVSNLRILGVTFDYNNATSELRFEAITSQPTHNNLIKDCVFRKSLGTGRLLSFLNTTENWDNATGNTVVGCDFDGTEATNPGGTSPAIDFSFQKNALFHGNLIHNVSIWRNQAVNLNLPNLNMTITDNVWRDNTCDNDLTMQQQKNCVVMGNVLPLGIKLYDCRDNIINGNYIRQCFINDNDVATIPGTAYTSLYRGSQRILISGNAFNTISIDESVTDCIRLIGTNNATNPFKSIFIIGNSAKVYCTFFRLSDVNTSLDTTPHENIIISNNHILERTLVDNSTGVIQFTGNVAVTNSGLKTCLIQGNYIGGMDDDTAGGHADIRINTTGFENMVVRDNWFSNDGVTNINNYPNVFGNFASPTGLVAVRRDSNTGTATITTGNTTVVVNHGVAYTPTLDNIKIVPTNSMGSATKFYIDTPTSTQFTIHVNTDPGGNATFAWHVSRGSGV